MGLVKRENKWRKKQVLIHYNLLKNYIPTGGRTHDAREAAKVEVSALRFPAFSNNPASPKINQAFAMLSPEQRKAILERIKRQNDALQRQKSGKA
ncbi:MAG: hypothetical protein J4478_01775 [Candidatus Diapherotrites archaeon]|uniref:Uncharacterized protein n=1 Tax=Candidatus Iainarchaeum sp. TaxID=3101447 RepID=A0A8T4KSM3_9ARCH|nr:hypothetical protein [Candidatus Diapherotrites archaeon]